MNRHGIIYLVNNNVNDKKYIGMTAAKGGFNGRYRNGNGTGIERIFYHLDYSKNRGEYYNKYLYESIVKYGFDNFTVNEEFDIGHTKEELIEKEIYWISFYDSCNQDKGYNLTKGGEGFNGWWENEDSLIKRRISRAKMYNEKVDYWLNIRKTWKNPFFNIWNYKDGLDNERKEILFFRLLGDEMKSCQSCGIQIRKKCGALCKRCL